MFTRFFDRHSGGVKKTQYDVIYIEDYEDCACEVFELFFHVDPFGESCSCCGPDFSIDEVEDLKETLMKIGWLVWECENDAYPTLQDYPPPGAWKEIQIVYAEVVE